MTDPTPATVDEPVEAAPATEPATVAGAHPDPAIAPGVDPDDPATFPGQPAEPVWVRYTGHIETTVVEVGRWLEGEAKHVAGWLAGRLLKHPDFEVHVPPAPYDNGGALPAATATVDNATDQAEPVIKPNRSRRTEPTTN